MVWFAVVHLNWFNTCNQIFYPSSGIDQSSQTKQIKHLIVSVDCFIISDLMSSLNLKSLDSGLSSFSHFRNWGPVHQILFSARCFPLTFQYRLGVIILDSVSKRVFVCQLMYFFLTITNVLFPGF